MISVNGQFYRTTPPINQAAATSSIMDIATAISRGHGDIQIEGLMYIAKHKWTNSEIQKDTLLSDIMDALETCTPAVTTKEQYDLLEVLKEQELQKSPEFDRICAILHKFITDTEYKKILDRLVNQATKTSDIMDIATAISRGHGDIQIEGLMYIAKHKWTNSEIQKDTLLSDIMDALETCTAKITQYEQSCFLKDTPRYQLRALQGVDRIRAILHKFITEAEYKEILEKSLVCCVDPI